LLKIGFFFLLNGGGGAGGLLTGFLIALREAFELIIAYFAVSELLKHIEWTRAKYLLQLRPLWCPLTFHVLNQDLCQLLTLWLTLSHVIKKLLIITFTKQIANISVLTATTIDKSR